MNVIHDCEVQTSAEKYELNIRSVNIFKYFSYIIYFFKTNTRCSKKVRNRLGEGERRSACEELLIFATDISEYPGFHGPGSEPRTS